jgi:putative DNA primase/helicase
MFLCYGNGSNGKTTFQEIVNHIIGEYGDNVNSEVLMQQKVQANNTFTIAKLKDARYVETDETDEGERLSEGIVKRMTGGGQMSAAFKYANEFSFMPKFKIWLATNNKPIIRGTDLGIWRRIFPFPFIHTFTEEEKDKDLPEKLKAEADKILGWCIKGYKIYNELRTIKKPKCLEDEIKEYQQQMDVISQFIDSECKLFPTSNVSCRNAYKAYKSWCIDNNAFLMSEMKFSKELQKKGFKIVVNSQGVKSYQGFVIPNEYDY